MMLRRIFFPENFYFITCKQRFSSIPMSPIRIRRDENLHIRIPLQYVLKFEQRFLSESTNSNKHYVDFEQVQKALNNKNIYIIDVREPEEIRELGKIPNSINIPLDKVFTTLSSMNDELFIKTYKRSKPSDDSEIIFYCAIGKRSGMAQKSAYDLGYKNAKNYVGSYNDWSKKYI